MFNIYKVEKDLRLKEQALNRKLHETDPTILQKKKCK